MKLRCTKDSIRVRIRKSELEELVKQKKIIETVHLGEKEFSFFLEIADVPKLNAKFENDMINIFLPEVRAMVWAGSNQVSLENVLEFSNNRKLQLLVEKDFPCKNREEENYNDTFWELSDGEDNC